MNNDMVIYLFLAAFILSGTVYFVLYKRQFRWFLYQLFIVGLIAYFAMHARPT